MNILKLALLFATTLRCVAASGKDTTPNKMDQGKRVKRSSKVRRTVPTSSTGEDYDPVFPSEAFSGGQRQLFPLPIYNLGWRGWQDLQHAPITSNSYAYYIRSVYGLDALEEEGQAKKTVPSDVRPEDSQHRIGLTPKLVACVQEGNYKRLNELLSAMEHQERRLLQESGGQKNMICNSKYKNAALYFCASTFSERDMQFKKFFISCGKELHSKCPIIFTYLYEGLIFYAKSKSEDLKEVRNLLGQPFPLPPKALVNGFLFPEIGLFLDSDVQRFFNVAPRETIEEGILGPNEELSKKLWMKVVERSSTVDPTFPPSTETLKNALERFRTKDELEEAWSDENAHRFKAKVLERVEEIANLIFPLELLSKLQGRIVAEYAAPTRFSWIGLIQE
jgi:hypothetical protein